MTRERLNYWQAIILIVAGLVLLAVAIAKGDSGVREPDLNAPEPTQAVRATKLVKVRMLTADGVHFCTLWQFKRRDPDTGEEFTHPMTFTDADVRVERLADGTYAATTKADPATVFLAPEFSEATYRDEVCR